MNVHTNKTSENVGNSVAQGLSKTNVKVQDIGSETIESDLSRKQDITNNSLPATNVQRMADKRPGASRLLSHPAVSLIQRKENKTGLPDELKSGVESLSGISLDDVHVHRNSNKPETLQAHAYAQGTDIHVGPGKEKHLPHEAWHVVQQKQGRVQPTIQMKGTDINDDVSLEKEADLMGAKASLLEVPSVPNIPQTTQASNSQNSAIQRVSIDEADRIIDEKYKSWRPWYFQVCMPAMQTIATKAGQSLPQYLAALSGVQFEAQVKELKSDGKDGISIFDRFKNTTLVDSDQYPGMKRVVKTNILVDPIIADNDANLHRFIDLYKSGGMVWYRGLSISHFSYATLRETSVLGSEGTADLPTFTMDNPVSTRWLPGLYDRALADAVAHRVDGADAGIREILTRKEVPIGVTVQYPVISPALVAYLNDGEQVIRGPIVGPAIYRVILMGPIGNSYRLAGGALSDLPPVAPYQAAVGSAGILAWEGLIDTWLVNHP